MGEFLTTEISLKMMKNVFYFMLKILCFLKIFAFCPDILAIEKNGLIKKSNFISRFMTSKTAQQVSTIHTLPRISRSHE